MKKVAQPEHAYTGYNQISNHFIVALEPQLTLYVYDNLPTSGVFLSAMNPRPRSYLSSGTRRFWATRAICGTRRTGSVQLSPTASKLRLDQLSQFGVEKLITRGMYQESCILKT